MTRLELRPAAARGVTARPGVVAAHSFSFGASYDPANTALGPLVALNEERLDAGHGYDDHRHSGLDVVSWVVRGELEHRDSGSGQARVSASSVAVLRSGGGVTHAEHAAPDRPVVLLQSWLLSPGAGPPSYACRDFSGLLAGGGLVRVAAGPGCLDGPARPDWAERVPLPLTVPGAELHLGRLAAGERVELPPAELLLLHVAGGGLALPEPMSAGDELRAVPGTGDQVRLRAGGDGAELMVWALPAPGRA